MRKHVFALLSVCTAALIACGTAPNPNNAFEDERVELENEGLMAVSLQGGTEENLHPFHKPDWVDEAVRQSKTYPNTPNPLVTPDPSEIQLSALPAGTPVQVRLKFLVLTTALDEQNYLGIKNMLERAGTPFDTLNTTSQTLTQTTLETSPGLGNYNGIIYSTDLSIESSPGVYESSFSAEEQQLINQYQLDYRVRRLNAFTFPDAGGNGLTFASGTSDPITVKLTTAGRNVFNNLNVNASIRVRYSYTFLSTLANASATPLLQTSDGKIIAATHKLGNLEQLNVMTAQSDQSEHTNIFTHGLINWLSKGVFVGDTRMYLGVQVDDFFLATDHFDATLNQNSGFYRMTPKDLNSWTYWVDDWKERYPLMQGFVTDMAFNGIGYVKNQPRICTPFDIPKGIDGLSAFSNCHKRFHRWVSHTYSHYRIEQDTPESVMRDEILQNVAVANGSGGMGLASGQGVGQFDVASVIPGQHSGLGDYWWRSPSVNLGKSNASLGFLQASSSNGIKNLASGFYANGACQSTTADCNLANPSPNQGQHFPSSLTNADLLIVPRLPPGMPYNITTPSELRQFFNFNYGLTLSYREITENDTDRALFQISRLNADPWYFHQGNLRRYQRGAYVTSLLGEWLESLGKKYSALFRVRLQNRSHSQLGQLMREREAFDKAGASAIWNKTSGVVSIAATDGAAKVPLTNTKVGESTGTNTVVQLKSGQSASVGTN